MALFGVLAENDLDTGISNNRFKLQAATNRSKGFGLETGVNEGLSLREGFVIGLVERWHFLLPFPHLFGFFEQLWAIVCMFDSSSTNKQSCVGFFRQAF